MLGTRNIVFQFQGSLTQKKTLDEKAYKINNQMTNIHSQSKSIQVSDVHVKQNSSINFQVYSKKCGFTGFTE